MNSDYVKAYRSFLEWEWYDDANVFRVFFHLLLLANWKPNQWRGILIDTGSLLTSYEKLTNQLGFSKQQIRTTLTKLKSTGEIVTESTRYGLLITLCNWGKYQSRETVNQQANQHGSTTNSNRKPNTEATRAQHGSNPSPTPLEEGEESKKEKKVKIQEEEWEVMDRLKAQISGLLESWSPHFNADEEWLLSNNAPKWHDLTDDDWAILTAWYAEESERTRFRSGKMRQLIENVGDELAKARREGFTAKSRPKRAATEGPSWLPDNWRAIATTVTGEDCSALESWKEVPLDHRGAFERACREENSGEEAA